MPLRRSFKTDESFLEKVSEGAIGTRRVFDHLKETGHQPLELERGSMSYKIWKTVKIKRIRVPDLLCVRCGTRVESRAKTGFELSMSHSLADPERGWDSGLRDEDVVAIVVCRKKSDSPVDWEAGELVQYFNVRDMRAASKKGLTAITTPKGAQEGFEARIFWPTASASAPGKVSAAMDERIQFKRTADARTISLSLNRGKVRIQPVVKPGDQVEENQVLASVVPVAHSINCPRDVGESHYASLLKSPSLNERYTGAKGLGALPPASSATLLKATIGNREEHVYVRLEAAASLAKQGDASGFKVMKDLLQDEYLQNRLEAVIVLGEVRTPESVSILVDAVRDPAQHAEIRAGAAWALGETRDKKGLDILVECFQSVDEIVRIEAARGLAKLAQRFSSDVVAKLSGTPAEFRPGLAWAASRAGKISVGDLIAQLKDDDARQWVAYVLGTQEETLYIKEIEKLRKRDPEVYFATTVLWKIMSSWVYGLEEN